MKKILVTLVSCSLALAAGAVAQQDEPQASPAKKQARHPHQQEHAAQGAQNGAAQPANHPNAGQHAKQHAAAMENNSNGQSSATSATATHPDTNAQTGSTPAQAHKGHNAAHHNANANANANANSNQNATSNAAATPAAKSANINTRKETDTATTAAAGNAQANNNNNGNRANGKAKRPADVQKIKAQHASFHAEARPQQVAAVTFNQNAHISGAEHWQGAQYDAFRTYHSEQHDRSWYHSHYNRIELIGGGYYYFNAGYWYPAWGYAPTAQYYVYDGPIYAGRQAEPPDRVIADVQASLQEMGYYKGEVDGLLGPLTREALTQYQSDNGLYATAAIDEPTLDSLGMGS